MDSLQDLDYEYLDTRNTPFYEPSDPEYPVTSVI